MNNRKINSRLAIILWLVLIFILSAQPVHKANGLSKGIAEKIIKIIEKISPDKNISLGRFNHYLRKAAHFFFYMILGILMMNVLKMMKVEGAQVKDVVIDTAGAIVGIGVCGNCRKMS